MPDERLIDSSPAMLDAVVAAITKKYPLLQWYFWHSDGFHDPPGFVVGWKLYMNKGPQEFCGARSFSMTEDSVLGLTVDRFVESYASLMAEQAAVDAARLLRQHGGWQADELTGLQVNRPT